MKASRIAEVVGGVFKGNPDAVPERVVTDSRKVSAGDLFVAIKGKRFDGNDFVGDAFKRGAIGVLTQRNLEPPPGKFLVVVEDTVKSLGKAAEYKRKLHRSTFTGVAGSAGKTTTKELVYHLLSYVGTAYKSEGNLNTEIGLPVSLLNMKGDPDYGVFEIGATRLGDVSYLTSILKPQIRVITALGEEHLESFGTFENVVKGNGEILENMEDHHVAVIPRNAERFYSVKKGKVITFGEGTDIFAERIHLGLGGTSFVFKGEKFSVPVLGRGIVESCLCAFGVLKALGYDPREFKEWLEKFEGVDGRMRLIDFEYFYVIDDTYNANPLSIRNAVETLSALPSQGKKVAVLGDMLELGENSPSLHSEIGKFTTQFNIDYVLFYGREMKHAYKERLKLGGKSFYSSEREEVGAEMLKWAKDKNIILIKGSRGMQMEYFLSLLKEKKADG